MDYFVGLDISMDETHVCVLDREGMVVRESKTESTAQAVANELAKAPSCRRIVFETGRMAPILFHGSSQLGLPVACVESRQAYQALKSLATHMHGLEEASASQVRQTSRVVAIGLVSRERLERLIGLPAFHADHGQTELAQPVEQDRRDSPRLEYDATTTRRFGQFVGDRLCSRLRLALANHHALAFENANMRLVH